MRRFQRLKVRKTINQSPRPRKIRSILKRARARKPQKRVNLVRKARRMTPNQRKKTLSRSLSQLKRVRTSQKLIRKRKKTITRNQIRSKKISQMRQILILKSLQVSQKKRKKI